MGGYSNLSPDNYAIGFMLTTEYAISRDNYNLGGTSTQCNNGEISGSTGPGSCSANGGVSGEVESTYQRWALGFGLTYEVLPNILAFGTGSFVSYQQYITVGINRPNSTEGFGLELGGLWRPLTNLNVVGYYSTEASSLRAGIGASF